MKIFLLSLSFLLLWTLCAEGRELSFCGYEWNIKEASRSVGPGPNRFSHRAVEEGEDSVLLSITPRRSRWFCAEIYSDELFSYGTFTLRFTLPRSLDSQAVFGFFLYNDELPPYYNEIDFEASRWGIPGSVPYHFSVQPYGAVGNSHSFEASVDGTYTCRLVWSPEKVVLTLLGGTEDSREEWAYRGDSIPVGTRARVHMNLWLFEGGPPMGDGGVEIELLDFSYEENY